MFPPELRDEDRLPTGTKKVDFSQKHPLFNDLCPQDSYTEDGVYWVSCSLRGNLAGGDVSAGRGRFALRVFHARALPPASAKLASTFRCRQLTF